MCFVWCEVDLAKKKNPIALPSDGILILLSNVSAFR